MRTSLLLAVAICMMLPAPGVSKKKDLTDHPLISPYEGSEIRRKDVKEFDEYQAFVGMDEAGKEPKTLQLEGKVTKLFYTRPKDRSILEVFRNYESVLKQSGAEILYTCDQGKGECVKRYAGPTLQKLSGLHAMANTVGRYVLAKIEHDTKRAYIAVAVGQTFTDIHVVEVKKMETGKVTLDAAALAQGIDARGYVVVNGIFFDTNQATLKPASRPALEQMAKLLADRPSLEVYIVGHTDMEGSLAHNQSLSKRRAQAVVDELAKAHGVKRSRMSGHGVGPLAPQASNKSDAGRASNRRVVLVAK